MKRSVGSDKPIKVRGALGAAASIVYGILAACGQTESNPEGQAQSGGTSATSGGRGGSSSLVPVGKAGFAACGSLECPLEEFEKACCWNHDSNTSDCNSPEQSCTFGRAVHLLHCDETADCPASHPDEPTGCIFDWRNGGGRAVCSAPLRLPQLEATLVIIQLCNPDAPDDDCGSGTCQPVTDQALLSGLLPANFHACY
jgi:hypothetical protein